MSDPNPEEAPLNSLSDDYIRDLEPENQRYDITLAQDFVVSVLPNGIKTWAFIYDFQGRHRRKTLGVFPEMNFDDAKVALEKARASMLRMDEPTVAPNEFGQLPAVLGGSHYSPKKKKKPFNFIPLLKMLGGLGVLGVVALIGMKVIEQRAAQPAAGETEQTAPASLPFAINKKPATPAAESAPETEATSAPPSSTRDTGSTSTPATPSLTQDPSSSGQTVTELSGELATEPATEPATPREQRPAETETAPAPRPTSAPSSASTQPETPPVTSPVQPPVTALTTTTKATAFGGSVARSVLTSRVDELEPTDTLGPEISYKNSGFTRVFYYTELREFGDGDVVHRWSLNGKVIDEVALKVKKSWRWRTYSNKDITPGLNGEWKVETIDATGKILDSKTFTYDYQ